MRDEDFDQIMDSWADHETESAPEMQPTASMIRMVRARQKRTAFAAHWGWAAAGVALASLIALAVLATLILPGLPSNQQVASIGLRKGFEPERGVIVTVTDVPPEKGSEKGPVVPPEKGHKKEPPSFQRLEFQIQRPDSQPVESIDLTGPQPETVTLTSADNYRLFLVPGADSHVLVVQQSAPGFLTQLLPNSTFSSLQNPLRLGQAYPVPQAPNWFYLDDGAGQQRLTIIASAQPLQELQDLVARYSQEDNGRRKKELLEELLNQIDALEATRPEEVAVWVFSFDYQ